MANEESCHYGISYKRHFSENSKMSPVLPGFEYTLNALEFTICKQFICIINFGEINMNEVNN